MNESGARDREENGHGLGYLDLCRGKGKEKIAEQTTKLENNRPLYLVSQMLIARRTFFFYTRWEHAKLKLKKSLFFFSTFHLNGDWEEV